MHLLQAQQKEGAKRRIFDVFEAFLTYTRHKTAANTTLYFDFAAFLFLPFALPFASPFASKYCAKGAAKTPQVVVPQKRRKI